MSAKVIAALLVALTIILGLALSWAATVGIVWLICRLLDLAFFTTARATAIWLGLTLLGGVVRVTVHKD